VTGPAGAMSASSDSPIEAYLDQLLAACLPGRLREARHLVVETEAHLRDAAAEAESRGLSAYNAEEEAVARFGSPADLAAAERRVQTTSLGQLVRQCVSSGLLLGSIGGLAVGVSGIVAALMETAGGQHFLVDPPSGAALSAANCARWLAASPRGSTCAQAGLADWAHDTVLFRMFAGVVGILALAAFFGVRRWWSRSGGLTGLPAIVVETAAVVAFGAAGVWLAGLGIDSVAVSSGHGAGQWLSAAPVALALAVVFGLRLMRDLRGPSSLQVAPRNTVTW
jgi:hypothetical protein